MKLFTKEIDKKLFEQYKDGSNLENQVVVAKIFNPYGNGTWYLLNSDPEDPDYIWAIVDLHEIEVGSVSRSQLESIKLKPFMLGLERDMGFTPKNAMEVYKGLLKGMKYMKGGEVDNPKTELEKKLQQMQSDSIAVRAKVISLVGIDDALSELQKRHVISPYKLIESAISKGFITIDEVTKDVWNEAVYTAEEIDGDYLDSGEGIGSSDINFFLYNMLKSAGIPMAIENNRFIRKSE